MTKVSPGPIDIHFSMPSDLRYSDLFTMVLMQLVREVPIPEDRLDWVALALREAVNNAVLHGNKKNREKMLEVDFEVSDEVFVMRVWDQGPGFDESRLGDPRNPENLFRPNGRGIFLIRQLMDETRFVRKEGFFGLEMRIVLSKRAKQEAEHE